MTGYPTPLKIINKKAGTDLSSSQYKAVVLASDDTIHVAGANAKAIGFLGNKPVSGQVCEIMTNGGGAKVITDATLTVGDELQALSNGNVTKAFKGCNVIGIALDNAVAGDVVPILVQNKVNADSAQIFTSAGSVNVGVSEIEISGTSAIATTLADSAQHVGFFTVTNTSPSGTAAHTLTLSSGTFDGTNNVATLNAKGESLIVHFDSTGLGTIIKNTGAVALS